MRGSSLVEFLCATSFFLVLVLTGFKALDAEMQMSQKMIDRTRPEEESNFRLLAFKAFFQSSAARFRKSAVLSEIPFFFSGLDYGRQPSTSSFSMARPMADPMPFIHEGFLWRVPLNSPVAIGTNVALAGMTSDAEFTWNYGRVTDVRPQPQELHLLMSLFLTQLDLQSGYFVPVEMHGFAHNNNALYWIGPSGQSEPYFGPVEEFSYQWSSNRLIMSWRSGLIQTSFSVQP
jgi:hypothetical protein